VRSDWMAVQHERGVSAPSAAMGFEHDGLAVNLLDTSYHQVQRGHLSVRLSAEQPCGCHNRMVYLRISAPKTGWRRALEGVGDT
jgi:hypothetical protein